MKCLFAALFFVCVSAAIGIQFQPIANVIYEKLSVDQYPSYNPPSWNERAKRARYLLHYSNWGVIGTISTHYNRSGLPFTNVIVVSDGPLDNSTGVPYFYVFDGDMSVEDAVKNNEVSLTLSENTVGYKYCNGLNYDPELPLCARVTLAGKLIKITDAEEKKTALNALFTRHPDMRSYPSSHGFYPARLDIELVWIIDYFGPSYVVPLSDYWAANPLL
ncbi:protein CREG1-like [Clavelina lepadiformis]|uniref:protein CREG1-like n=1 Tax=Clavelina lepadiformis TaxID=159417 RepID=UPI004041C3E4